MQETAHFNELENISLPDAEKEHEALWKAELSLWSTSNEWTDYTIRTYEEFRDYVNKNTQLEILGEKQEDLTFLLWETSKANITDRYIGYHCNKCKTYQVGPPMIYVVKIEELKEKNLLLYICEECKEGTSGIPKIN